MSVYLLYITNLIKPGSCSLCGLSEMAGRFSFSIYIIVISLHWNISLPNFEVCVIYARKTKILLFDY